VRITVGPIMIYSDFIFRPKRVRYNKRTNGHYILDDSINLQDSPPQGA
jgi:hypothetical protein